MVNTIVVPSSNIGSFSDSPSAYVLDNIVTALINDWTRFLEYNPFKIRTMKGEASCADIVFSVPGDRRPNNASPVKIQHVFGRYGLGRFGAARRLSPATVQGAFREAPR
jgi:hypothetical protein